MLRSIVLGVASLAVGVLLLESPPAVARGGGGGGSVSTSRVVTSSVRPGTSARAGTRVTPRSGVVRTRLTPRTKTTTPFVQRTSTTSCARYAKLATGSQNATYWKRRAARCQG